MADTDSKIEALLKDPTHGAWDGEDSKMVYTPNPSFFDEVTPTQLAQYFEDNGKDFFFLKLP